MANWRRPCSSRHPVPPDVTIRRAALLAAPVALLAVGCGQARDENAPQPPTAPPAAAAPASPAPASATSTDAQQALCVPAGEGQLRARLQGAIDAEVDWAAGTPQCRGGPRPGGDGVRLIYKGTLPGEGPLLVVIGIGPLRAGQSTRDVPVNLTLVREGTGRFYATQGDDKCAMDEVRQEPAGDPQVYRLTGRGYCVQPARAVGADGAVLMSRFDVKAIVDYR
jgi:hypothetical protein